jgi:TetR/AcrR family transcriptional regulator, fatty acid metabolism regulator protein
MSQKKISAQRDPENTRHRIEDAALEIFANKGYHQSSIDEIVAQSGTSKGAVYFHFPNKQELFMALVDKFADLLERRVVEAIEGEADGMKQVSAALETCIDTFGKYRPLAKILLVQAVGLGAVFEQKRMDVQTRFALLIKTYLDRAVTLGQIAPLDSEVVAYAWMGALNEMMMRWIYTGSPTPERLRSALIPLFLQSVGGRDHA